MVHVTRYFSEKDGTRNLFPHCHRCFPCCIPSGAFAWSPRRLERKDEVLITLGHDNTADNASVGPWARGARLMTLFPLFFSPRLPCLTRFVIVPSWQDDEEEALELKSYPSDVECNGLNGLRPPKTSRRSKRQRSSGSSPTMSRRRARTPAAAAGRYVDSEEDDEGEERGSSGRGARRRQGERGSGVSEVTFFTHLTFSAYLPDFQEMEACRHFVGPLHILQVLFSSFFFFRPTDMYEVCACLLVFNQVSVSVVIAHGV